MLSTDFETLPEALFAVDRLRNYRWKSARRQDLTGGGVKGEWESKAAWRQARRKTGPLGGMKDRWGGKTDGKARVLGDKAAEGEGPMGRQGCKETRPREKQD